jgi:hypothetical protein
MDFKNLPMNEFIIFNNKLRVKLKNAPILVHFIFSPQNFSLCCFAHPESYTMPHFFWQTMGDYPIFLRFYRYFYYIQNVHLVLNLARQFIFNIKTSIYLVLLVWLWVSKNNIIENIKVYGGQLCQFVHHIKITHKIGETKK